MLLISETNSSTSTLSNKKNKNEEDDTHDHTKYYPIDDNYIDKTINKIANSGRNYYEIFDYDGFLVSNYDMEKTNHSNIHIRKILEKLQKKSNKKDDLSKNIQQHFRNIYDDL